MAIFVTPRDTIDCNQLQSLLHKHENVHAYSCKHVTFQVGQKVAVWLFPVSIRYTPNVGDCLDECSNDVCTTNELAKRLVGY